MRLRSTCYCSCHSDICSHYLFTFFVCPAEDWLSRAPPDPPRLPDRAKPTHRAALRVPEEQASLPNSLSRGCRKMPSQRRVTWIPGWGMIPRMRGVPTFCRRFPPGDVFFVPCLEFPIVWETYCFAGNRALHLLPAPY